MFTKTGNAEQQTLLPMATMKGGKNLDETKLSPSTDIGGHRVRSSTITACRAFWLIVIFLGILPTTFWIYFGQTGRWRALRQGKWNFDTPEELFQFVPKCVVGAGLIMQDPNGFGNDRKDPELVTGRRAVDGVNFTTTWTDPDWDNWAKPPLLKLTNFGPLGIVDKVGISTVIAPAGVWTVSFSSQTPVSTLYLSFLDMNDDLDLVYNFTWNGQPIVPAFFLEPEDFNAQADHVAKVQLYTWKPQKSSFSFNLNDGVLHGNIHDNDNQAGTIGFSVKAASGTMQFMTMGNVGFRYVAYDLA